MSEFKIKLGVNPVTNRLLADMIDCGKGDWQVVESRDWCMRLEGHKGKHQRHIIVHQLASTDHRTIDVVMVKQDEGERLVVSNFQVLVWTVGEMVHDDWVRVAADIERWLNERG